MKGVYIQSNSPYYWIRYYDKLAHKERDKRRSVNTKIEVTPADRKLYLESRSRKEKPKYRGTPELKRYLNGFKTGLNEKYIHFKHNIRIIKELKLSEGFQEFISEKSVPGSKKQIKPQTIRSYSLAVDHMIKACGDKKIYKYTDEDYITLLKYFGGIKIPLARKKDVVKVTTKPMSINARAIYTRGLHSLWNYFIHKTYTSANIIEPVDKEEKDPDPIPPDDMRTIIKYFRQNKDYQHHYWIIYFMLLTGCRPSSAMVQSKEDVNFKTKIIKIKNVKSGKRKKKEFYSFPLYKELENLLSEQIKPGDRGRLFDMFTEIPGNYTWPLSFWKRAVRNMNKSGLISAEYTLKQIRPTFISFLINELKMDIYTVYKLADHADIYVTDKHYVDFKLNSVRKELDEITLDDFSENDLE